MNGRPLRRRPSTGGAGSRGPARPIITTAAVLFVLAGCSPGHGVDHVGTGARRLGAASSSTTEGPSGPVRGLPVAETEVALVDTGRPVARGGTVLSASRPLPTSVWTPSGLGRFPLVVFVHGYDTGPPTYQRFCSTLASSGYVVAAPSFPLEDPALGFGLDRSDLPEEATDVSFVITALERGATSASIDPSRVAVAGHSDGADVALMLAYEPGTADARIRAVIADAPDPVATTTVPSSVPLLLLQGTADSVVPYSASQTVFRQLQAPVFYLSLIGADHLAPIAGGTAWTPTLDAAAAGFLDASIAGRGPGQHALAAELTELPLASLQTAP